MEVRSSGLLGSPLNPALVLQNGKDGVYNSGNFVSVSVKIGNHHGSFCYVKSSFKQR